jgi:hypothetical protein
VIFVGVWGRGVGRGVGGVVSTRAEHRTSTTTRGTSVQHAGKQTTAEHTPSVALWSSITDAPPARPKRTSVGPTSSPPPRLPAGQTRVQAQGQAGSGRLDHFGSDSLFDPPGAAFCQTNTSGPDRAGPGRCTADCTVCSALARWAHSPWIPLPSIL